MSDVVRKPTISSVSVRAACFGAKNARKAEQIGLVHAVDTPQDFDNEVEAFLAGLAEQPGEVLATAKLVIALVCDLGPSQSRDAELLSKSLLVGGASYRTRVHGWDGPDGETKTTP